MMKSGSLCSERIKEAFWYRRINPRSRGEDTRHFNVIQRIKPNEFRCHYVFYVLADCQLEEYDAHPPPISYSLSILNEESHLPGDEEWMLEIHAGLFITLFVFFMFFLWNMFSEYRKRGQYPHLIRVLTFIAYVFQMMSVFCEMCHLYRYADDGKGLRFRHTWFALDFMSEIYQQTSEMIITVVLLALSAGWTLKLPVLFDPEGARIDDDDKAVTKGLKALTVSGWLSNLKNPLKIITGEALLPFLFFLVLFTFQVWLEYYGRQYEEDFNSFHDHEHWPGYLLMTVRVCWGILFYMGTRSTLKKENMDEQKDVQSYINKLSMYGALWFFAFPILVISSMFIPIHWRHMYVTGGSICFQTVALLMMLWNFGRDSSYLHLSTLGDDKKKPLLKEKHEDSSSSNPNTKNVYQQPSHTRAVRRNVKPVMIDENIRNNNKITLITMEIILTP
eukprot:UN06523